MVERSKERGKAEVSGEGRQGNVNGTGKEHGGRGEREGDMKGKGSVRARIDARIALRCDVCAQ